MQKPFLRKGLQKLKSFMNLSRRKQEIKEKMEFAEEFIGKMSFIYSLKKNYLDNSRFRKKLKIADSLRCLHLQKKALFLLRQYQDKKMKKNRSIRFYAFTVIFFFLFFFFFFFFFFFKLFFFFFGKIFFFFLRKFFIFY